MIGTVIYYIPTPRQRRDACDNTAGQLIRTGAKFVENITG